MPGTNTHQAWEHSELLDELYESRRQHAVKRPHHRRTAPKRRQREVFGDEVVTMPGERRNMRVNEWKTRRNHAERGAANG